MTVTNDPTEYSYFYVDTKDYMQVFMDYQLRTSWRQAVRVFKSDPLEEADIPCVGINVASADQDAGGIGLTSQPPTYDAVTGARTDYKGLYMRETIELRVFHTNPDERDKLRIFCLSALFAAIDGLQAQGLREMRVSGGRDEQDVEIISKPLFMHTLTLSYLNPLTVTVTTAVAPADGSVIEGIDSEGNVSG